MSFRVGNLKQGVSGLLTGTNLANVTNLYGAFERAARVLLQRLAIPEAMGREVVILYDHVYDYPVDNDLFGTAILDFRPQGDARNPWDYVYRKGIETFDRLKQQVYNGYLITFEYRLGVPFMRISTPNAFQRAIIDPMNALMGWVTGGNASGLALDSTFYFEGNASLRFNLAAAGSSGYIEKTIQQIDLSSYTGVGVVFLAFETPDADAVTSLDVRLGSSPNDYYEMSAVEGFVGAIISDDWCVIAFELANAAETGTVDMSKVDYFRATVNYDGTFLPNVRMGGAWVSLPSPHELIYENAAVFETDGVVSNNITNDNDVIMLRDAAYTIYEFESAKAVAMQMSGGVYTDQIKGFDQMLEGSGDELGLYARFRGENPSEEIVTTGNWYNE